MAKKPPSALVAIDIEAIPRDPVLRARCTRSPLAFSLHTWVRQGLASVASVPGPAQP